MKVPGRVRTLVILFLIAGGASLWAATRAAVPVFDATTLGKGAIELSGPWQFQTGDNAGWAAPSLADATSDGSWGQITAESPWGAQGFPSYVGYGWYRRHIRFTNTAGATPEMSILIPHIDDAYEVYWNGILVGSNGRMPPDALWYYSQAPQTFALGPVHDGVLAIRVWKAPLKTSDSDLIGGFAAAPVLGTPEVIASYRKAANFEWLSSRQYTFAITSLYAVVALLSLLGWSRDRSQRELLWMAVFCSAPVAVLLLTGLRIPWSSNVAHGLMQPILGLQDISLWFLLLWLLKLDDNPRLAGFTMDLAWVIFIIRSANGALMFVDLNDPTMISIAQVASGVLTLIFTLTEVYPLVLVALAFRNKKKHNLAHWLVAACAFLKEMIFVASVAAAQGSRFTHWTLAGKIDAPLFTVLENPFTAQTIANTLLLFAIIYAVYRFSKDTLRRQGEMEAEFKGAREVQQVLIPDALPPLPGYAITSAYRPAQEVGGDFFQIIPLSGAEEGAALIVLGDVSGKGLKAALAVSLIVGTLRTLAESTPNPAAILNGLNRSLHGRLRGGFATCFVLKIFADGSCSMANAGHPAPFINKLEIVQAGALPLGIVPESEYEEITAELQVGDHIVLYTDGLLEARTASGELFSFRRLAELIARRPNAKQATEVAQEFGQEDDITVLTVTRLAAGAESTTHVLAPQMSPAA